MIVVPFDFKALLAFFFNQLSAALFALLLLAALLISKLIWQPDWWLTRYDALVLYAVLIQFWLIIFKLETWDEARVILVFHITGTVMEIFKTAMGSWLYPEESFLRLGGVPLFTGFMYAAIGSYIARVIRLYDVRFKFFPPFKWPAMLAVAVYCNFFIQHYTYDFRWILLGLLVLIYWRTQFWFDYGKKRKWIPLLLFFFLLAFALWVAENIGTFSRTWTYETDHTPHGGWRWELVSWQKIISWFLLMQLSFVLVMGANYFARSSGIKKQKE